MGVRGRGRGPRRYVLKADPSRQWRLLDLQAIDTRLDQIAHAKKTLPQLAQLKDLQTQSDLLGTERWPAPAAPTVHAGGSHVTAAVVRGRVEMLFAVAANVAGLSAACPWIVTLVDSLWASFA